MRKIEFYVCGEPQGKARPRVIGRHAYTPEKTVAYENRIRLAYKAAAHGAPPAEKGSTLQIAITAYYAIPQKASRAIRDLMQAGTIRPTRKPDVDNIGKVVLDALNGIAYHDDAQVIELVVGKYYDQNPRIYVRMDIDE